MTFKIVVAGGRSNDPEVHKVGCRDLKSSKYDQTDIINVSEVEDAARWFWEDFLPGGCAYGESGPEFAMTDDYAQQVTKYHACLKGLPSNPERDELYEWIGNLGTDKPAEILAWLARCRPDVVKDAKKAFAI